jgi:predicted MFS family arabinose efflux permease
LLAIPLALIVALQLGHHPGLALIAGLGIFAVVFAINSAIHSYLVLAYTDEDSVALNVGFYYMANAGGRLLGTLLSGLIFQFAGFQGCLWGSAALLLASAVLCLGLPRGRAVSLMAVDTGGAP